MATSRYTAMLDERAALVAEGKAMFDAAEAGGRDLTAEERTRDDAINARIGVLNADISREEARREREAAVGHPAPSAGPRITGLHDRRADKPWGGDAQMHGFGEFLQAVYRAGSGQGTDVRLLYQAAGQGANEAVGADGGFLVPKQYGDDIAMRMHGGEILSRVAKRTLTSGNSIELNVIDETSRATGSRHGGVAGYWVDEGTAPTGSRPKFARQEWKPRKVACLGYATDELLADASLVEGIMFDAFSDELQFLAENAIVNGTGVGTPQGLLNSPALISVAKETGQTAATIEKANIDKMWARLYSKSRQGAVWLINQDIEPQLYDLQMVIGTGGVPVFLPPGGLSDDPHGRLFGRPVISVEYCPTLGTVGDIILVNLQQYLLVDRGEPQQASSMHVAFTTDEMAFRVTYRVDGHLRWLSAITPFQGSNTQGPVVALATRA